MEILDLALRLRSGGWSAAAAPDAIGIHLGSRTYGYRGKARQRRIAGFSRGYLLRRYGVLRRRVAARALFTEVLVVLADAILCRDLAALRGRVRGWRAARGMRPPPLAPAGGDRLVDLAAQIARAAPRRDRAPVAPAQRASGARLSATPAGARR